MKKNLTFAFFVLFASSLSIAQNLADKTMTFYGVDFSKAKMIGEGFNDPNAIKNRIFGQWNALFTVEADKYDLRKPFKKDKVILDFANVEKNNKAVDAGSLVTNNDYKLSDAGAESVLQTYSSGGKTGLGCVFVVESFNKTTATGTIHVIMFDIATHKVLLHKKLEEKPAGGGLKNYWARTILYAIEDCQGQFGKWLKGK